MIYVSYHCSSSWQSPTLPAVLWLLLLQLVVGMIRDTFCSLPYGGKLWRVQTLADLAENRPTANF